MNDPVSHHDVEICIAEISVMLEQLFPNIKFKIFVYAH